MNNTRALVSAAVAIAPALLPLSGIAAPQPSVGSPWIVPVARTAPHGSVNSPPHRPAFRGAGITALMLPLPGGCTSTFDSFIGIPDNYNFAGANVSSGIHGYGLAAVAGGQAGEACDDLSFIGSGTHNVIGGDGQAYQSAIAAGAYNDAETSAASAIVSGYENLLSHAPPYPNSNLSFIGAGQENQISGPASFIGAGTSNTIVTSNQAVNLGQGAFIGSGANNANGGNFASIVGGSNNKLGGATDLGAYGFIGGGQSNTLEGEWAGIASGRSNSASGSAAYVGGGVQNSAAGTGAFVGAGTDNSAGGAYASVPGGDRNAATGAYSFAAGTNSLAAHTGTFVWSDAASGAQQLKSQAANQFLVRASGGVAFYSNAPLTSGVKLAPGGGSWASLSDRTAKTDIRPLDGAAILAKVAALPVTTWTYRSEPGVRHVGPMAQDFYAAFRVGEDDRHITTIDEDGVALAAIKALDERYERAERRERALYAQNRSLAARLARIEARLALK
jgi:hypothetical protein